MNMEWTRQTRHGYTVHRLPIQNAPAPYHRRKYLKVLELAQGEVFAETVTGYLRRCSTVEEAKRYLEEDVKTLCG